MDNFEYSKHMNSRRKFHERKGIYIIKIKIYLLSSFQFLVIVPSQGDPK